MDSGLHWYRYLISFYKILILCFCTINLKELEFFIIYIFNFWYLIYVFIYLLNVCKVHLINNIKLLFEVIITNGWNPNTCVVYEQQKQKFNYQYIKCVIQNSSHVEVGKE